MKVSNIKILYKILSCFAMLTFVVAGAIWFSASRMQHVNDKYSHLMDTDVVAMRDNIRSNVRLAEFGLLIWEMISEESPAAIAEVGKKIEAVSKEYEELISEAKQVAPHLVNASTMSSACSMRWRRIIWR